MRISVVIPCRNEAPFIEECIRAVYNSQISIDVTMSVFVVDGLSDDGTRDIIQSLKHELKSLELLDNVKQLTPFAFNIGIHASEFDFIQIVGARHIISTNYIDCCLRKLIEDTSVWCVGGRIENEFINETGKVIANAMGTTFGMGIGNFRTLEKSGFTDTVTSPMYPKFVFDKVGYFDENLIRNQDDDFNYRVTKAGGKIYYDHNIYLKYYVRGNYNGLWKQFFQYGYWKVYVNQKHKAVTTMRQLVPPIFVLYLIFSAFITLIYLKIGVIFDLPLLAYCGLAYFFALKVKEKNNDINLWDVFKTFPILHVSYGLGYLRGIWDFLLLNKKPSENQKTMSR